MWEIASAEEGELADATVSPSRVWWLVSIAEARTYTAG